MVDKYDTTDEAALLDFAQTGVAESWEEAIKVNVVRQSDELTRT